MAVDTCLKLAHCDASVRLRVEPATLARIKRFLGPYFTEGSQDTIATIVVSEASPDGSLEAAARGARRPIYTSSEDSSSIVGHLASAQPETIWVSQGGRAKGTVTFDRPASTIVIRGVSAPALDFLALRALRDLIYFECQTRGWAVFHGSATVLPGVGLVVVCGHSGCGKTSTMVRFVSDGAALVTNDRVLIQSGVRQPLAQGWPTWINLKPAPWYPPRLSELFHGGDPSEEVAIEPWEFVERMGARVEIAGRLAALVVVERDPRLTRWFAEPCSIDQVAAHCLTPVDGGCHDWLAWSRPIEPAVEPWRIPVPTAKLRWGSELPSANEMAAWLDATFHLRRGS